MQGLIEQVIRNAVSISALVINAGYRIIQITEEEVPLAPGAGSSYLYPVLGAMVVVALILTVGAYGILCYRCRQRIAYLDSEKAKTAGWRLWKLKEMVVELEEEAAEESMRGMEEILTNL